MKPETAAYIDKARRDLADAKAIAAIGLSTAAARTAYYAAFHAAEAVIIERTVTIAKTHSGLRSMIADLSRTDPAIDKALQTFLGQAYVYKEISDYGVDREATVTPAEAQDAIAEASRLIERIAGVLRSAAASP